MSEIKLKPEYKDTVFGFNNSGKPLGERDDLHLLIKVAKEHKVKSILDMFEEIPTDEELLEIQASYFNKKKKVK